ncbi:MAG: 6-bladed beta-propeller [Spirochaetaceae bacterium]
MTERTESSPARATSSIRGRVVRSILLSMIVVGMLGFAAPGGEAQDIDMDRIEAEEEFRFGVRAFHNGRYNDAILSFSRSVSFAPEDMRTRYWLGRAYYFGGFVEAALNQWQYIVDAGEGSARLRALIDTVSARQGVVPELYEPGEWAVMSELEGIQGEGAVFRRPVSIEPRGDGSFYLTSFATQEVVLLSANGVLEQRLRGGLAGFDQPFDVLFHDEVLFVSEFGGDRVSKVNMRGNKILTFGGAGTGEGNLLGPQYLATDGRRFIYVSDWGNGRICKYDFDGEFVQCFGATPQGDFRGLREPTGIAWLNGRLFVADASDGDLHVFDDSGNHLRSISGLALASPEKMTVIENGELLIADGSRLYRIDPEEEVLHEVSDVAGSSDRVTSGVIDANGNLLATDFDEDRLYFLSRVPNLYSGLHVQIERVVADSFPEVYVDIAVQDRLGNPIVGLDASNFFVTENGRRVGGPELVAAAHAIDRSRIALLLDKSEGMAEYRSDMGEAATQLAAGADTSLSVVSAGESPVLEAEAGSSSGRVADVAASAQGFTPESSFDEGLYFTATSLLDSREHRGIVFVTNGELGQGAFRNYGLQELAALLRNNHIRFYVVYVTRGARDDALEYLSSASGGDSMFLYRDDGISGIVDELADHPSGRYTLRVSSGSDTDFGRAYIPLEVEAYLIRRSGRDEAGYFGPREF